MRVKMNWVVSQRGRGGCSGGLNMLWILLNKRLGGQLPPPQAQSETALLNRFRVQFEGEVSLESLANLSWRSRLLSWQLPCWTSCFVGLHQSQQRYPAFSSLKNSCTHKSVKKYPSMNINIYLINQILIYFKFAVESV